MIFSDGNFGLHRDGGLAQGRHSTWTRYGEKSWTAKKCLYVCYRLLDVTLDLQNESNKSYRKLNEHTVYEESKLNYPEHVLKHIPVAVNNRLKKIFSSQSIFNKTIQHYQEAIRASAYDHELAYIQS